MKRYLLGIYLLLLFANKLYSQSRPIETQSSCWRDTTLITIDSIADYQYVNKRHGKGKKCMLIHIIKAHYADKAHEHYCEPLFLVSLDTIMLKEDVKKFRSIKGIGHHKSIHEGEEYLFHITLYNCLPIVGGLNVDSFDVDGIMIPKQICPLQPYRAKELNGLDYFQEEGEPSLIPQEG